MVNGLWTFTTKYSILSNFGNVYIKLYLKKKYFDWQRSIMVMLLLIWYFSFSCHPNIYYVYAKKKLSSTYYHRHLGVYISICFTLNFMNTIKHTSTGGHISTCYSIKLQISYLYNWGQWYGGKSWEKNTYHHTILH